MRALLDVNVLIALLDADHVSHRAASAWFAAHAELGWASCAITQNGCLRVMTQPGYPQAQPLSVVAERLRTATLNAVHEFSPDDISLLDTARVDWERVHGPRQITDVYLLALAVAHGGRLVTFDGSIARSAVRSATPEHLLQL